MTQQKLEKLIIKAEQNNSLKFKLVATAQFNPTDIRITKQVEWRKVPADQKDAPKSQFTSGNAETLSIKLFFDSYYLARALPIVTDINEVIALSRIEQHGALHRPPICQLIWGEGLYFQGVLTNLVRSYTMFMENGSPVRAELDCTFTQFMGDEEQNRRLNRQSPDVHKIHMVKHGDTISSISREHYDDPTLWRHIAKANGISNPRALKPGQVLRIPILKS